jgi:hypothetical protein
MRIQLSPVWIGSRVLFDEREPSHATVSSVLAYGLLGKYQYYYLIDLALIFFLIPYRTLCFIYMGFPRAALLPDFPSHPSIMLEEVPRVVGRLLNR